MRLSTQPGTQPFRGSSYTDHAWWQPSQESRGVAEGKEHSAGGRPQLWTRLSLRRRGRHLRPTNWKKRGLDENGEERHIQTVRATRESHCPPGGWCVRDGTEPAKADYMTSALFKKKKKKSSHFWFTEHNTLFEWLLPNFSKTEHNTTTRDVYEGITIYSGCVDPRKLSCKKPESILRFAGFMYPCAFCPN